MLLRECRRLPAPGTLAYWDKFNDRIVSLWKLYDSIAKEKRPANFYFANLGGGIRSAANLVQLGEMCEWFQCDNQGRGGDDAPIWGSTLQGRVCNAVQKGKMSTNVTGGGPPAPALAQPVQVGAGRADVAGRNAGQRHGALHHFIGGEKGMGEDRRWLEPARRYFNWMARHDAISSTSAPSPISAW